MSEKWKEEASAIRAWLDKTDSQHDCPFCGGSGHAEDAARATAPSDDLVKRFHGEEWSALPDRVRVHIRAIEAENIRLRADLTAMEACKNTYATLAYAREQEVFKLRAELGEAKKEIYLAKRLEEARAQQPDWEKLWAEVSDRAEQAERDLAEARAQRDASDAVIAYIDAHRFARLTTTDDQEIVRDFHKALARHRAAQGGK